MQLQNPLSAQMTLGEYLERCQFDTQYQSALLLAKESLPELLAQALVKTGKSLRLMEKHEQPRLLFKLCSNDFARWSTDLQGNANHPLLQRLLPDLHRPMQLTTGELPITPNHMHVASVERLYRTLQENQSACSTVYRKLIQSDAVTTHLPGLRHSSELLMQLAPGAIFPAAQRALQYAAQANSANRTTVRSSLTIQRNAQAISNTLTMAIFAKLLIEAYGEIEARLQAVFIQALGQLQTPEAARLTAPLQTDITISQPMLMAAKAEPPIQRSAAERERFLLAKFNDGKARLTKQPSTAIERQIEKRHQQELAAQTQLKQLDAGSIVIWHIHTKSVHYQLERPWTDQQLAVSESQHSLTLCRLSDRHVEQFKLVELVQALLGRELEIRPASKGLRGPSVSSP